MKTYKNIDPMINRALKYLNAIGRLDKRYQSRAFYRQRLLAMAEGLSPRPLGTVGGGSPTGREQVMARLADLESELMEDMTRLQAVRDQAWDLFSQLSHPLAGQVLEDFYLNDVRLHVIAAQAGYSERRMYFLKDRALRELGKLLTDQGIADP